MQPEESKQLSMMTKDNLSEIESTISGIKKEK